MPNLPTRPSRPGRLGTGRAGLRGALGVFLLLFFAHGASADQADIDLRVFAMKDDLGNTTGSVAVALPEGLWRLNKKAIKSLAESKYGKLGSSSWRVSSDECYIVYKIAGDGTAAKFKIRNHVPSGKEAERQIARIRESGASDVKSDCNDGTHAESFSEEELNQHGIYAASCSDNKGASQTVYISAAREGIYRIVRNSKLSTINVRGSRDNPMGVHEQQERIQAEIASVCETDFRRLTWISDLTDMMLNVMAPSPDTMFKKCVSDWKLPHDSCSATRDDHEACLRTDATARVCAAGWHDPNQKKPHSAGATRD